MLWSLQLVDTGTPPFGISKCIRSKPLPGQDALSTNFRTHVFLCWLFEVLERIKIAVGLGIQLWNVFRPSEAIYLILRKLIDCYLLVVYA